MKKIIRALESTSVTDLVEIEVNDHNLQFFNFSFPITQLYGIKTLFLELAKNRLVVSTTYREIAFADYITKGYKNCVQNNLIEYRHNTLGWFNANGQDLFLYDKNSLNGTFSVSERTNFSFTNGNKQTYLDFLRTFIYPVPTLSLALSIGYSAVVASRLKDVTDTGVIIVNLCGASSTGKTTAEQLLVSPFASPKISNKDSLIRTFSSTTNALYAGMSGINGLPIVLDDVTTAPNLNLANLIYTVASGEEKSRCNSDGKLRDDGSGWSGLVVISSETPIQDASRQNQGLQVRVIQTQGITWTPNAEAAEYIKRTVLQNYGFTGKEFAEYVRQFSIESLFERYEKSQSIVDGFMKKRDNLTDRLASKYAIIHLTILLMNECFGTSLNADNLISILLKPEQDNFEERDIAVKAHNVIVNYIVKNKHNFFFDGTDTEDTDSFPKNANLGTIKMKKDGSWLVYIPTETTRELLSSNGINEIAAVKKKWKERKITKCDNDHNSVKYCLNETVRRCDCFIFPKGIKRDSFYDDIAEKSEAKTVPLQSPPVSDYAIDDEKEIEEIFTARNDKDED